MRLSARSAKFDKETASASIERETMLPCNKRLTGISHWGYIGPRSECRVIVSLFLFSLKNYTSSGRYNNIFPALNEHNTLDELRWERNHTDGIASSRAAPWSGIDWTTARPLRTTPPTLSLSHSHSLTLSLPLLRTPLAGRRGEKKEEKKIIYIYIYIYIKRGAAHIFLSFFAQLRSDP